MVIIGFVRDEPVLRKKLLDHLLLNIPEITSLHYALFSNPNRGYSDSKIICYDNTKCYLAEKIGNFEFHISPKAFFQPNSLQAYNIYQKIHEYADCKGNELVYDLYTGVGNIACFIAQNSGKVIGIENSVDAIHNAIENAEINNLTNIEFIVGDILETFTHEFVEIHGKPDIVILDPPRSGTLIEIKKTILAAEPKKIIYLSCNPVSLAWDLKQLTEKYRVSKIEAFDMLPHTYHSETLVLLEKMRK
jgi:23S rRNA (uracil1939-C5)-methyltransferase